MPINIAIDGPVGAGKSTISDAVAARLGILHLDTGAMYRAMGLAAIRAGLDLNDENAVTALCGKTNVRAVCADGGQRTYLGEEDVTALLRTEQVSRAASAVSRYQGVRKAMVRLQQALAATTDMLVDGRDIGTVVLPEARVKIYLTASDEERARRRWLQMKENGSDVSFDKVLEDLRNRDWQDMHRAVDPLRAAEDAVVVDTTGSTFEASVDRIVSLVREKEALA